MLKGTAACLRNCGRII